MKGEPIQRTFSALSVTATVRWNGQEPAFSMASIVLLGAEKKLSTGVLRLILSKVKGIGRFVTAEIVGAPRYDGFDLRVPVPY